MATELFTQILTVFSFSRQKQITRLDKLLRTKMEADDGIAVGNTVKMTSSVITEINLYLIIKTQILYKKS